MSAHERVIDLSSQFDLRHAALGLDIPMVSGAWRALRSRPIPRSTVDRLAYWRCDDLATDRPPADSVAWLLWLQVQLDGHETAYGQQCRRASHALSCRCVGCARDAREGGTL